ncbi:aldehyde dehydrogenase family protein [Halomicrococcus sp. NG-SE-24]|uniref:aldehyde dehydrogenase family protein n=1 Tax=Halomicrococcus sp. NG-SE-24 TaxID=3436928 RepID=UPI003D97AA16
MRESTTNNDTRGHFIGGREVSGTESIAVVNPATGNEFGAIPDGDSDDVDAAIERARARFADWNDIAPAERGRILTRIAETLRENADSIAALLVRENGKSRSNAATEVEIGARYFEYYAGIADKIHGDSIPLTNHYVDYTLREPLGVTAHIVPWNFPVMLLGRTVAPALAAGNATIVKPAEQTPLTAIEIAQLADDAGLPDGVLNVVQGYGPDVGAPLAGHPDIDGVAFTGSVPTGRDVATRAVENFNPVHIEAGGKNPHVVFPDADLDNAIEHTLTSIFTFNAGQVCSAGDRLILHDDIHDEFLDRLIDRVRELTVGPGEDNPDVSPIVSETQFDHVIGYIDVGREEIGEPVIGGDALDRDGYYIEPTIFDGVTRDMRIAQEEIFGPVLAVLTFTDEAEAIKLANDTEYGLVAGIQTTNVNRAHRFARDVDAGQIYVNEWFAGGVETPFGGYEMSGFGREKGLEAIENFTQTKNVCLNIDNDLE